MYIVAMSYELKLETYQGPLDKLLELIEERKMEVGAVSLGAVTDDFLKYLETLAEGSPAVLAYFIVVASRLLLIKSKALLPDLTLTAEEEEDIGDLTRRLELYKRFKAAERHVRRAWREGGGIATRPYLILAQLEIERRRGGAPSFFPGGNVTAAELLRAITLSYESIQKFVLETETVTTTLISLEEKMKEVVERMAALEGSSLARLAGEGAKSEIIVLFLALLHLAREQLIVLEQGDKFSDIIVKKSEIRSTKSEMVRQAHHEQIEPLCAEAHRIREQPSGRRL